MLTSFRTGDITGRPQIGEGKPRGVLHRSSIHPDHTKTQMLVLGTLFQCLDPVLTVAACLSSKPLFLSPMDKREEANTCDFLKPPTPCVGPSDFLTFSARERFASGNSDLLTDVNAYAECIRRRNEGASQSAVRAFCEEVRRFTLCHMQCDLLCYRTSFPLRPSETSLGSGMSYSLHSRLSTSFLHRALPRRHPSISTVQIRIWSRPSSSVDSGLALLVSPFLALQ